MSSAAAAAQTPALKRTPLYDLHIALGAKIVPFAGYEMPVQYAPGIIKEHLHTRAAAGLFDISHMGQVVFEGGEDIRAQAEKLMPGDFEGLAPGQMRYSFLLDEQGRTLDDLMVTRPAAASEQNTLFVVVNGACKDADIAYIRKHLKGAKASMLDDRAMLALQGPAAAQALSALCPQAAQLKFMQADKFSVDGIGMLFISRSGYTGEDGFEISVPAATAEKFARLLLAQPGVMPIGLGARDSLRLEAGLCLYGHDLDPTTTPIEAGLTWAIGKRRREQGGFIGAAVIQKQLKEGVARKRVGIQPETRAIARDGSDILNAEGRKIGTVTSGGFGASVDGPIAMGYAETAYAGIGTPVNLVVRGAPHPAKIAAMPFVPHRYIRG